MTTTTETPQRRWTDNPERVRLAEINAEVLSEFDHVASLPPVLPDEGAGAIGWAGVCAFVAVLILYVVVGN